MCSGAISSGAWRNWISTSCRLILMAQRGLDTWKLCRTDFTAFVLAISIVVSSLFAEEISSGMTVFEGIYPCARAHSYRGSSLDISAPMHFCFQPQGRPREGLE